MKTAQLVKILLVVAIMFTLLKLVAGGRGGRFGRRRQPRGYTFDRYEGYMDDEDNEEDDDYVSDEDEDEEEDEEDEDEDEEYDSEDSDYEEDSEDEDEDDEEDSDYEDDEEDSDYEDDEEEDSDYEDDEVEGFANAAPSSGRSPGAPMMNVATDLLPKASAHQRSKFGEFAPKSLLGQNFLDAKKYIGVDTKGSSLRNANYDLRSSPAIPRKDVGPWSNSTIEGDLYRKPLE